MKSVVFVYAKNKEIKVLDLDKSKELGEELVADGWVHTHTLEAAVFLNYLYKLSDEDVLDEIRGLSGKTQVPQEKITVRKKIAVICLDAKDYLNYPKDVKHEYFPVWKRDQVKVCEFTDLEYTDKAVRNPNFKELHNSCELRLRKIK